MRRIISRLVSGLRWRLLLLVLLVCAPLVGLILHTAGEERRQQVEDWRQRSQELMKLATREEEKVIGQTRQLLLAMAESSPVRSGNRRDCKKYLDDLFASYPRYANLGVVRTNGMVLASALSVVEPANQTNRQFFRRVLKTRTFSIGDFPVEPTIGKATVNFGCPVFDPSGQIQAVVFAVLDLDWFNRFESEVLARLPKEATWTKIDQKGTILVRYPAPEKWIGKPFPEQSLVKTVFRQDKGLVEAVAPEGDPGFYAFASMHSQLVPGDSVTILAIPKQALFAEADRRLAGDLMGLGIAAGVAFMLGWLGSYLLILRPVRTLVSSSARLATGEFSTRTGLAHREDELGQLTNAFDHMAQALEQRELDHQRAEHELRQSEERFRALVQNSTDVIGITDAQGIILYRSPSLQDCLGYEPSEVLGKSIAHYMWPEDLARAQERLAELVKSPGGTTQWDEYRLRHRDGSCRFIECTTSNYLHEPAIGGVVFNYRDITKRKQAEGKLEKSRRRLEVLSRRLVEVQEAERRHIALELHDEIGQALTVAEMNLQAALQSTGDDALTTRLQESLDAIERVLEQVHDLALNLRPSMLDDLGLVPALVWLTNRQAELAGLKGEVKADALEQRLDTVIETECFRVAQEALTNVVRHAQARTVIVDLRTENDQLHLRVRDDGVGFDVATVREKAVRGSSLGLLSMEERAALAGGGLEFTSASGQGSEVHAWFPLKWQIPQT